MSKFFANNLQMQKDVPSKISAEETKEVSIWTTQISRISKETLIHPHQPSFLPQLLASLMACWVLVPSGASLGYFTSALTSLQHVDSRLPVTDAEGSWMASLVMLGAMCGGLLSGPCISLGRRTALWIVSFPLMVAWILVATASNVLLLYSAHSIFGICVGIATDAAQLYVSEAVSAQWRGMFGCIPPLMFNIGILLCYMSSNWLNWEETAIVGCALSLPGLIVSFVIPESPGFLVTKGRTEEAKAALHRLRGDHWDISTEYDELLHCEKGAPLMERLLGLCSSEILKPLALTGAVRILSRFCGLRALLSYTQTILLQSKSSVDVQLSTIISGAVQLFATLAACIVVDRLGRRKLLMVSQIVMGASMVSLGCYILYEPDGAFHSGLGWIPITALLVFIIAYSIGLGPVSGILIGELIPQHHRSIASSITGAVSWLSAFIVTKTFLDMQSSFQLYGVMWLYGSICFSGVVFIFFCLPETRGISSFGIEVLFKENKQNCIEKKQKAKEEGQV